MKTTITIIALLLAGCASQDYEYDRQVAQIEAREAYENQKELCGVHGGVMVIRTNRGSRLGEPDYRKASCSAR